MQMRQRKKLCEAPKRKWDGRADNPQEDSKNRKGAAENGKGYKAEFLGMDSSKIQNCKICHGAHQEGADLATARGKRLLQMLPVF